jgi:hypothetical protein
MLIQAANHYLDTVLTSSKPMAKQNHFRNLGFLPRLIVYPPGQGWKGCLIQGDVKVRRNPHSGEARVHIATTVDSDGPVPATPVPAPIKHTFFRENRPLIVHKCIVSSERGVLGAIYARMA